MFVRHDDVICILGLGDMTCRIGADSCRLSHQLIIQYRKQSNTISIYIEIAFLQASKWMTIAHQLLGNLPSAP